VTLRLKLEYDGTGFRGWARQPGERTVEGALRDALDAVVPGWTGLAVAGRTDAGVHATGQVASFDAGGGPPTERLAEALNAALPDDVGVVRAEDAVDGFHARFSATDDDALHASAAVLVGEHDFTAFTPTGTEHEALRREIRASAWERRGDELHFTVTADSFLRHMVRTLVGTMLEHGPDTIEPLLEGRPRAAAGTTAPPWGLFLEHVHYDGQAFG